MLPESLPIRLSQAQLNTLETCPRLFQHLHLDQLGSPIPPDQQESLTWGSRFHLLMQQQALGLPVVALDDDPLQRCLQALRTKAPEIFQPVAEGSGVFRDSEHSRTLGFTPAGGNTDKPTFLLTVVYDLLVAGPQAAEILDWKTYPRPQRADWLAQHWQTRLYLYVLAETSQYRPEQISMTYWFVQGASAGERPEPESIQFIYSTDLHTQTHEDLHQLLGQALRWLEAYQEGQDFPQVNEALGRCRRCQFAVRCDRAFPKVGDRPEETWRLDLSEIQEIPL